MIRFWAVCTENFVRIDRAWNQVTCADDARLQGQRFLRAELPGILATPSDVLSPRMGRVIEDLAGDWHRLDERIEGLSSEIGAVARQDAGCERLMSVPS